MSTSRHRRYKITGWHFTKIDEKSPPYLIHLSQEECNVLERGTTQVFSPSSIILKSNTAFWKFNRNATRKYLTLALKKMFMFTLLPSSLEEHGNQDFYKFESLQPPLSREHAKQCLLSLLDGLHHALEELHKNNIAHLDVRLPNICFRHVTVILIDADQCEIAQRACTSGVVYHHMSDMYKSPCQRGEWTNRHADIYEECGNDDMFPP